MRNGGHGFFSPILNERVQHFFDLYLRDVSAEIVTPEIVLEKRK
jgi:hypothetical protein